MWNFREKLRTGFTLFELIISIGLVAILSAASISVLGQGSRQYARDVERKSELESIASAAELYRNDFGYYPACAPAYGGANNTGCPQDSIVNLTGYLNPIPEDPQPGTNEYVYRPRTIGGGLCSNATIASRCATFTLCSTLEKSTAVAVGCGNSGCGGTCRYLVANP